MKRIILIALLLSLIACSKDGSVKQKCMLTATIDLTDAATKVSPDLENLGETLSFSWEIGDAVTISNDTGSEEVTVTSIDAQGKATLEGNALSDMSSYNATYGDKSTKTISCQDGTFSPIITGTGANSEFTLNTYCPVIKTGLKGNLKVTSIEYFVNDALSTTLDLGDGIMLEETAKTIYFPLLDVASKGTGDLRFYLGKERIMTQRIPRALSNNDFVIFPDLEIKPEVPVESITLSPIIEGAAINPYLGDTIRITATIYPENASVKAVYWESANPSSISIDQSGLASVHTNSGANITCRALDGSDVHITYLYCLAAGTRITLADGSTKKIENIVEGDLLRTFDHEAGKISSAKACMVYKGASKASVLKLTFASGRCLSIVGTHDLLEKSAHKYVRINRGNVEQYVGKHFYNAEAGTWDALVSFEMGASVEYYCIYTAKHLNCIAEGMLTCPDDVDHNLNIYELDTELKADSNRLDADIAKYGLFDLAKDYPECSEYKPLIEQLGGKYVKIAIGKGLVPKNHIETMKAYWTGK